MWGYIAPLRSDKRHPSFLGYYCALCRAILHDYGRLAQQTLSYDCAFMAMLIGGVYSEGPPSERRCMAQPFKKHLEAPQQQAVRFVAAANVLLAAGKCLDDWRDERSLKGWALYTLLRGARRKAQRNFPEMAAIIQSGLDALSGTEKALCAQMDEAAHAFAAMMGDVMALAGRGMHQREPLYGIGYNLGKWIYLMDAWDDLQKDQKSGAYNVLLRQFPAENLDAVRDSARERVQWNLLQSLHEARCAADLLVLGEKRTVLDQVLGGICPARQRAILGE